MGIHIPTPASRLAGLWNFHPELELEHGWCSKVYADQTRVLKCPWRGEEMTSGFRAALEMSGWFGPNILESDQPTGTILMERVLPGTNLAEMRTAEVQDRELFAALFERMNARMSPVGYPTLRDYYLLQNDLLEQLLETSPEAVFLHGDLHHFNILWSDSKSDWVVIDPKGLSGDPCHEAIALMRNLVPNDDSLGDLIQSRMDFFHQRLGFDKWRMAAWGYIDQIDSGEDINQELADVYEGLI
jgi:hypothetical protein